MLNSLIWIKYPVIKASKNDIVLRNTFSKSRIRKIRRNSVFRTLNNQFKPFTSLISTFNIVSIEETRFNDYLLSCCTDFLCKFTQCPTIVHTFVPQ